MAVTIPPARWAAFPGLSALADLLGGGESARIVGGAVRDTLLDLPVADVDLATRHPPEEVMRILKAGGIRAVPTGLAHGTVTAVLATGQPVEVTTLRRDVETDGRHALVAFTDDWREDAARRDFTINALFARPDTGEVIDYFDGLADLSAGRVRFIGDPLQRIAEDHLRILRFFRFHARFGDAFDEAGLDACTRRARDLMALSRERIAAELLKLLVAPGALPAVRTMVARGILTPVLPEIDTAGVDRLARLIAAEAGERVAPDPIRRLAALLPPQAAEDCGARLRLSNADRKRLAAATAGPDPQGPRALAYRAGRTSAIDRLLLSGESIAALADWEVPRLPLTGGALIARGMAKGPLVAAALRQVESRWIAEGFPALERVDQLAEEAVAASSSANASSASSGRA